MHDGVAAGGVLRVSACECDYDAEGDPLEYVKVSHYCPLHDLCECCMERMGKHRVGGGHFGDEWLCDECVELELA